MIFVVLVFLASVLLFLYKHRAKRYYEDVEKIPGPPGKPFIGNALDFGTNTVDILINLKSLVKKYGTIVRLWVGPNLMILLSEPRYLGQLLLSNEQKKSKLYKFAKSLIGTGLVVSSGDRWKKHRRLLAPMFNNKNIEDFIVVFNKNANELVRRLRNLDSLGYVDVTDYVWECAFHTIYDTTMQVDIKENTEYFKAVTWLMANITNRNFSIVKRFDFLYQFTSDYRTEMKMARLLDNFTDSIIAARRKQRLTEIPDQTTFLDHLLNTSEEDPSFTDIDIRDQVKTFIIAGSETVVTAASFGIFELAKHPEIQQKILEEIQGVVGVDKNVDLALKDVDELKYLDCVFKEILRMHGPATIFERELSSETRFDDYTIPSGTTVILFAGAMHCDERNFPEPMKFDPDRFLPENAKDIPPHAYMPFGAGPRICIGQKYATVEAKLILAEMVRNFELAEVQPRHEVIYRMEATLKCANGLPIKLKIR